MTIPLFQQIHRHTFVLVAGWSLISLIIFGMVSLKNQDAARRFALEAARESLQKDLVYRIWNAEHGGVYVPVTEKTPPNPYLAHLPHRDLTTAEGKQLTLVNPAYMTRQVHEIASTLFGSKGHITSSTPLRPENRPDLWEEAALQRFEQGEKEVSEVVVIDDEVFLRTMLPMMTEERCLPCHAVQGYRVGELRGGVSVATPMESYLQDAATESFHHGLLLLTLWGVGSGIILLSGRKLSQQTRKEREIQEKLAESEQRYRQLFDNIDSAFTLHEVIWDASGAPVDFHILSVNPAFEKLTGKMATELVGRTTMEVLPTGEFSLLEQFRNVACNGIPARFYHFSPNLDKYLGVHIFSPEPGQVAVLADDISERMRAEIKMTESQQRFHDLVNNTSGIVWELDLATFCFTFVSKSAESMLGYPLNDWYQPNFWIDHLDPEDRDQAVHYCLQQTKELHDHEFEYRMLAKDGRSVWLRDLVTVRVVDGEPVSLSGVMIDVTNAKQLLTQLQKSTEEAESANRAKTEFLANMSHELRTPLNGILGMLQMLSLIESSEEKTKYIDTALRSGWSLLDLLNDLLDLSRIEAGKLQIRHEPFTLAQTVQNMNDLFAVQMSEKRLDYLCHFDPAIPTLLSGDEGRVRQIFFNLLGNAIKFTPEAGRIELAVAAGARLKTGMFPIHFTISDNGIGIEADKLDTVFNPFVQGESVYHKRYQGAGLGLAIVKRLIDAMNGDIQIESQPGAGTIVRGRILLSLEMPVQTEDSTLHPGNAIQLPAGKISCRILLVEDNGINRLAFAALLRKCSDCQVETANNGVEALKKLAEADFDIVVMDIQMPVMDGLEALRHIRNGAYGIRNPSVPVIAMTAYAMEDDRASFLQAGMDDCLAKPLEWKTMLACLNRFLDHPIDSP